MSPSNMSPVPVSLPRSHPFAFVTPLSADACQILQLRANNALLEEASTTDLVLRFRLDFNNLFGRRCISFGSSRANEVTFPKGVEDVAERHFVIHFEMQTGLLLLTDTSQTGTWVSDVEGVTKKLLHRRTYPLCQNSCIMIGTERRFRFHVSLPKYAEDLGAFRRLFHEYAISTNKTPPAFVRSPAAIGQKMITRLEDKFIPLHNIGSGAFGAVRTCLRTSDGRLCAVKSAARRPGLDSQTTTRALECLRNEMTLLRRIRHVSRLHFPPRKLTPEADEVAAKHHRFC